MDAGELKELVESALEKLSEAREKAQEAYDEAHEARSSAADAESRASDAFSEADRAEDRASEAVEEMNNLEKVLDELMEKLSEETGDEVNLAVQLKRYGPKIKELRARGCGVAEIARRLSISEVIVNIALERMEAA